jgi:hypothetical protein
LVVVLGIRARFFMGRQWIGLLLAALGAACSSAEDAGPGVQSGFCADISAGPQGLVVANCRSPSSSLRDVHYDSTGMRQAFAFIASCGAQSARGTWDATTGLVCTEAPEPCEGGICTPASAVDCRLEPNCEQAGACGYSNGQCVDTEDGCAHSQLACGLRGECHLGPDGACIVLSDADCQMPFGVCPTCQFKGACAATGSCHFVQGQCAAGTDDDCRASSQCSFAGLCTFQDGACIAATDDDCKQANVCTMSAQCKASGGHCVAP